MTNPATCLHRVVAVAITRELKVEIICHSCFTTVTHEQLRDRWYTYDGKHNCWVAMTRVQQGLIRMKESQDGGPVPASAAGSGGAQ